MRKILKLMVAIRNWDMGSDKKKPTAFMLIISGVITTQMILLTRINCTFGHFIHFIKEKKGKIQKKISSGQSQRDLGQMSDFSHRHRDRDA